MSIYRIGAMSVALSVAIGASGVVAQDAAGEASVDATVANNAAGEVDAPSEKPLALDEIVVTAQKRAENIQDVPLSVTAVGGEALREKNLSSLNEVALYTPNTVINVGNGAGAFVKMRGLGSGNNKGFEQAVGLLIDGVYYGRIDYMTNALVDLDSIEIMRGPQGTLMGKNTIAGAISLNTVNPQDEWEFDFAYGGGERDRSKLTGIVNIPLVDGALAMRVVGQHERQDGYVYNTNVNEDQLDTHRDLFRFKMGFDGIENLSIVGTLEYAYLRQELWGFEINKATDQSVLLNSAFDPGFETQANYRNQTDQDGIAEKDSYIGTIKADYELGEYILTSVSGWSNIKYKNTIDADFGPIPLLTLGADDDWTQYSQEFRITSPIDTIDYVAGLYMFMSEYSNFSDLAQAPGVEPTDLVGGLLVPEVLQSALSGIIPGIGPIAEDHSYGDFYQESFSIAGFGQLRWHLLDDDLTLMAGLRYSYEEKEARMTREFTSTGLLFQQALAQEEFVKPTQKRVERDFSPKVSVTYAVFEDVNVYGTFAKAFKGGGFNASAVNAQEFEFDEEKADTFEAGIKGRFLGGALRINTAVFYTQFSNLQVSIFDGTKFVVKNAADATTKGVEFDSTMLLSEGLIMNLSVGYTKARYDSFPNGPCPVDATTETCDLSGRELDRAPDWNGTFGFNYNLPLGDMPIELVFGGDVNYQSDHFINTDLDPNEFQDAYFKYNARIAIQDPEGIWQFQINGKNLSDEMVLLGGADVPAQSGTHMGTYGEPRSITADFRVRF